MIHKTAIKKKKKTSEEIHNVFSFLHIYMIPLQYIELYDIESVT